MSQTPARSSAPPPAPAVEARRGLLGRQLDRYPSTAPRTAYLIIVVLATITLYYEIYVQGSVATTLAANLHMTLVFLISISIVGNGLGALAAIAAGLADRWGRANFVVYGLAATGALDVFGLANATSKWAYLVVFAAVSMVEGMILVATPALIRDFSPQLSRATAMCFWTMGPVLGSLVVSEVASHTLERHPDWQYQYRVSGIVGLLVFVVAFVGLRELTPQLRDQLMVSARDKALIEANARGIDPNAVLTGHWKQMMRKNVVGPAFAISIFLLYYYCAVGLFVVYFATDFGYSEARANALADWYWAVNAGALVVAGILSDALKVRKPLMLVGGLASALGVALFAMAATRPQTGYYEFVGILLPIAIGSAFAFSAWMAAFTETVEKHNPAATATGLAIWASTLRTVVVVALLFLITMIPGASTLVGQGTQVAQAAAGQAPGLSEAENATVRAVAGDPGIVTRVQAIAAKDAAELVTAQKLTPQTLAALKTDPNAPATQAQALSEISGIPVNDVAQVMFLSTTYASQLSTAATIDAATQAAILANPADTAAQAKAVGEIATAFGIAPAQAATRLQALAAVPHASLVLLAVDGKPVRTAVAQLTALSQAPPSDLALVAEYGPGLKDPKVVTELKFLQTNAPAVQEAKQQAPAQWQHWWWVCFAGQLLFLPFIWLLTGRWSPKKAKQDAHEHAERVEHQLAALAELAD
ncbi:MFS transporter [Actinospica durhamensis]|uniref:MFS transporter n=1 Tax=Actinospica durhamensis TaxID=1508375 RepID=A0A941ETE6_9ACTN|nr:MFS transporter [Actinospica durhamensis]MBR7836148.1 MFS transporter [Actinospica durhamensis]